MLHDGFRTAALQTVSAHIKQNLAFQKMPKFEKYNLNRFPILKMFHDG